jgi:2'-5' RNA ligase
VSVAVDVALRPKNRLFAALDLPEELRAELAARAAGLVADLGGRAVPAPNLHLTLAFLGQVPPERGAEAVAALASALPPAPAMRVRVGGLTVRPGRSRARLLAAELVEETGELEALGLRAQRALAALGLCADARERFWPHVTIVRFSRPPALGRLSWAGDERQFDVSRAALYDSLLSSGGPPRYEPVWRVDLMTPEALTPSA